MSGNVELDGTYLHQTSDGIKIDFHGDGEGVWLPKSLIDVEADLDLLNQGDSVEVEIPPWLAMEKGLI